MVRPKQQALVNRFTEIACVGRHTCPTFERSHDELNVLIKSCAVTFASESCQQAPLASEEYSLWHDETADETVYVTFEQQKAKITPDGSMLTADNRSEISLL